MIGRRYIILKSDYSTGPATNIKGHCKIERRGSKDLLVVNIENAERDKTYTISYLTRDKEKPLIDLGKVFIDDFGKARGQYNFSPSPRGAILIKDGENLLLAAYIGEEDGILEDYVRKNTPPLDQPKPMEKILEEILEDKEEIPEIVKAPERPETQEIEEGPQAEEMEYVTIDNIKEINRRNKTINFTLSILRHFPYIEPIRLSLRGYNWWLADLNAKNKYREYLPFFSHIIGGNIKGAYQDNTVTSYQLINKYRHYLFGIYNENEDIKYFIYGIPGLFVEREHPHKGKTGFNTWFEGKNIGGYWIIYLDPFSGQSVNMPVSMIPTE